MSEINVKTKSGNVSGFCDPKFQNVAAEFVKNFEDRGEIGASVSLNVEGETLLDLWGGYSDADTKTPWGETRYHWFFLAPKQQQHCARIGLLTRVKWSWMQK
jgi:CubicO group peptidase (beta-lactamase class C family)